MRVILHYDADGNLNVLHDPGVAVFNVDDRCPDDRVYLYTLAEASEPQIADVLGDDPVGSYQDGTPAAARAHMAIVGLSEVDGDA